MTENERYESLMQKPNAIFVFGSNLDGFHGGGAARAAHDNYGAEWGVGNGPRGRSYAIPTVERIGRTLTLLQIAGHVGAFLAYADEHPEKVFVLTQIGCGIAGYRDSEIAPLFADAPSNVILPVEWAALTKEG